MGPRLQHHLKDAALTALVAAGLGIFIVGFRTYDIGKGLTFDYQFVDLGIAIVTIFFGRLGLSLAADGLSWPALALGAVLGAIGASPFKLPSTFLHWFVTLAGLPIRLRTIWPRVDPRLPLAPHPPPGVPVRPAIAKWCGHAP